MEEKGKKEKKREKEKGKSGKKSPKKGLLIAFFPEKEITVNFPHFRENLGENALKCI